MFVSRSEWSEVLTTHTTADHQPAAQTAPIPADLHAPSLEAFADQGPDSLAEALSWVFPLTTPKLGEVTLAAIELAPTPHWHAAASKPQWVRPIRCTLESAAGSVYFELDVIPWMCDELAAAESVDMRDHSVGGHRGLYLGRPLSARMQLVARPGLRRRANANTTSFVLVPDLGSRVTVTSRTRTTLEFRFGDRIVTAERDRLATLLAGHEDGESRLSKSDLARLASLGRDGGGRSRRFSPAALASIDHDLGLTRADWAQRVLAVSELATDQRIPEPKRYIDELSPEALHYRPYGDLLRRTIAHGMLRAYSAYHEVEPDLESHSQHNADHEDPAFSLLRRFAQRLKAGALREVQQVVRPGAPGGVVTPADDRGTVAALEAQRSVTRYGPGGERRQGARRLWIRGLHPDRRGELCPLLTPESEDLGMIRGAALGARPSPAGLDRPVELDEPDDLSVASALIPFVNHDDPTRASIAARLMRQAVPIAGAMRAGVETAVADRIAEEHGVCRAPLAAEVTRVGRNWVELAPRAGGASVIVGFGPATPSASAVDSCWRPHVAKGARVFTGDLLASAPDVVIDNDGRPHLAQGRDCLVAYTPWHGWNFEDAIVVSTALVPALTSRHYLRFRDRVNLVSGELPHLIVDVGAPVNKDQVVVEIARGQRLLRTVRAPERGTVTDLRIDGDEVCVEICVERPLEVGDKLTNRHGAKGVVAKILDEEEMPRLADGRRVEMLLNPLGVIRRLNPSQLYETHTTLRNDLSGISSTELVGRRLSAPDVLACDLERLGAAGGRMPLWSKDGALDGHAVVVGWQHMLKLDHLAVNKERSRLIGSRSPLSQQPAKGSTWIAGHLLGGAQRVGEMEMWALQAVSADEIVGDVQSRSDQASDSLDAVAAHLRVAGLRLVTDGDSAPTIQHNPEGAGLQDLPDEIVKLITNPNLTTLDGSPAFDPLHDHHHGGDEASPRCACGASSSLGTVCPICHTMTRPHPEFDRRSCRFRIRLAAPIRHPWASDNAPWDLLSIPVLPPALRPYRENALDNAYRRLIIENAHAAANPARGLQRLSAAVTNLLGYLDDPPSANTIAARLGGKRGLLRRALRGRDTDYAARGVMVPDPTRDPETIGIPRTAAAAMGLDPTSDDGQVVLVNRQPTLLPTNLIALRPDLVDGSAFRIHPFLCARLAGDFDGDEVSVHRLLNPAAREEAWRLLRPSASYSHIANDKPMAKSDLDVALGLWLLGRRPGGRAELCSQLGLPANDPIATGDAIAPSEKDALILRVVDRAPDGRAALEAMTRIFGIGVDEATGWSFSAVELPDLAAQAHPGVPDLGVPLASALGEAMAAGVAGKSRGIEQLLIRRGRLQGFDGLPTPDVEESFVAGLDDGDFFATAPGGLRALSDKKLVSPLAGGLTKAVVEATYDVVISETDCGRTHFGFGTILGCGAATGVCARCYAAAGGPASSAGTRVGLLAAFAVGERGTQNAMKAFQGGTNLAVGGNVVRLRALLGDGRINRDGAQPTTLSEIMAQPIDSIEDLVAAYRPLMALVDECLDASVDPHHVEVIWRRLRHVHSQGVARPLTAAQQTGSAFVQATNRGDLAVLLQPDNAEAITRSPSALRLAVIRGGN